MCLHWNIHRSITKPSSDTEAQTLIYVSQYANINKLAPGFRLPNNPQSLWLLICKHIWYDFRASPQQHTTPPPPPILLKHISNHKAAVVVMLAVSPKNTNAKNVNISSSSYSNNAHNYGICFCTGKLGRAIFGECLERCVCVCFM